jgi:chromosome segregation protein
MRLKQIKLAGFKSFVDATTVILPGNRCAVVGPNGCGKSNIIDAVRWVMGESSAKQLRGENIADVIFSGSSTRKPNSAASIELLFDNSDGRIGGEYAAYADIAIRREVSRDGLSNYRLNGSKCRRRDIQDVFLGTGFGPRSYSIIEQGMISQLVEAKPEELRVYLEEAAGISKYKERRRETETRIRNTRENLERINDIREELGRQLDRLQRQAQAAGRYRTLKTQESLLNAQLYALRHSALKESLGAREKQILEFELALEKTLAEQRSVEAEIELKRKNFSEQSDKFNGVQERFYQLGEEIARIEEALQFNQQRVKQLELDLVTLKQRQHETSQQVAIDEDQILSMRERIAELQPKVAHLSEADASVQQRLKEVEEKNIHWQQRWDTFNSEAAGNDREAEVQRSRVEYLEQLIQRLNARGLELSELSADQPREESGQLVEQMALEINNLEGESNSLDQRISECLRGLVDIREALVGREKLLESSREEVQSLSSQLVSLQAVQEAALGQNVQEAEVWIHENGLSAVSRLGENLVVVPGWERAIEAVLGRFMQALRVEDLDDYADSLIHLDGGDLALVEGKMHHVSEARNEALGLPTVRSLLRSQSLAAGSLLHGVFAAESAQAALASRKNLQDGQSIITREGIWVGVDWMRILHDQDQTAGIIERGQALETLGMQVEEAENRLDENLRTVQSMRAQLEVLEAQREELQKESNNLNQNLSLRRTDHGVSRAKLEDSNVRRQQLLKETEEVALQLTQEQGRLDSSRQRFEEAKILGETKAEERKVLAAERETLIQALQFSRDLARSSRENFHELNVQLESLQSQLGVSITGRDRMLSQQNELVERADDISGGIENGRKPIPQLEQDLATRLNNRAAVETELAVIRSALEQIEADIKQSDGRRIQWEERVGELRNSLETHRVERQGIAVQETNLIEQIKTTGHELGQVKADMPEDASEAVWVEELERMSRRIQRLGAINLAAIEEFDQESERKSYLDAQAEDLDQALETLLQVMQKIDRETRSRFKDTFEAVNKRFGELFPKLFGGGNAYLELTGDDMLDTGVGLMARPPGKRNASIQLLSGGEKAMTAVALIFAIFHLNPSPVCLLDEVDAPLDDMNVARFAALIKEMSESVQFLVITHNKITMEMADYLMGVTMQEPGVSRLVSVDVEAAAALAIA